MPEIAEYHSIKKKLPKKMKIDKVEFSQGFYNNIIKSDIINLNNSNLIKIVVYGKNLFFIFDQKKDKIIMRNKLGMSGAWLYNTFPEDRNPKHFHIKFINNNKKMVYYDPRRFGKVYFYKNKSVKEIIEDEKIGIDLLEKTNQSEMNFIENKILKSNQDIKSLLLNQNIIVGLGNYLVSEILYLSKINPKRKGKFISKKELNNIIIKTTKLNI